MKLYTAKLLIAKIKEFEINLKSIDVQKADAYRDGAYTKALAQLDGLKEGELDLEILMDSDNVLKNIMQLAPLDATNEKTRIKK